MNLRTLPKVELHRHLEGALRYSTLVKLARAAGKELPFAEELKLRDMLLVTSPMTSLKAVLDKFWLTQSLLDSEAVLEQIAYEAVEDAHNEGVYLLELRYSLSFIQKNHHQLSFDAIHSSICKGLARASQDFPVRTGLIGILGRVDSPETQKQVADFISNHSDTFVGIDLADDENHLDTKTLKPLFERARQEGVRITVHAGESPGTQQNVVDAIQILGAERIGHGIQIAKFPDIVQFVKDKGVVLEICPYSNYLTNVVPSIEEHPIRHLIDAGVKVTINSDDPGIFGSDLTYDYELLAKYFGFSQQDFESCNKTAELASFIKSALELPLT